MYIVLYIEASAKALLEQCTFIQDIFAYFEMRSPYILDSHEGTRKPLAATSASDYELESKSMCTFDIVFEYGCIARSVATIGEIYFNLNSNLYRKL